MDNYEVSTKVSVPDMVKSEDDFIREIEEDLEEIPNDMVSN